MHIKDVWINFRNAAFPKFNPKLKKCKKCGKPATEKRIQMCRKCWLKLYYEVCGLKKELLSEEWFQEFLEFIKLCLIIMIPVILFLIIISAIIIL